MCGDQHAFDKDANHYNNCQHSRATKLMAINRHDRVVNLLLWWLARFNINKHVEPRDLNHDDHTRVDFMFDNGGRKMLVDVTVIDVNSPSHRRLTPEMNPGSSSQARQAQQQTWAVRSSRSWSPRTVVCTRRPSK